MHALAPSFADTFSFLGIPVDVTKVATLTCKRKRATVMNEYLIASIEIAQRTIQRFSEAGFEPAQNIERQLMWCWKKAAGEVEGPPPAELCMSFIMEQEFQKYGAYPMLAHHLRAIEAMVQLLEMSEDDVERYAALSA